MLLEYEKDILRETTPHSNLLVLGRGMGKEKIIYHQLKFYLSINSLVIILNFNEDEIRFFKEAIDSKNIRFEVPNSVDRRKEGYRRGGVFVLSETVFITDLINGFVDPTTISAFFISNAEYVKKDSPIDFIIDYTRNLNRDVIVRGFTDNPLLLDLELVQSILQVDKVFFYPRFAQIVHDSLKKDSGFLEKRLKMSKEIEEIQILILGIIKSILNELKREDKYNTDLKEIVEDFDLSKIPRLNRITKEIIDRIGYKNNIRRLVKDVNDFKIMIGVLFSIDFSCFFNLIESLWKEQVAFRERSTWINYDSGIMLIDKCTLYKQKNLEEKNTETILEILPSKQKDFIENKRIKKEKDDYIGESESTDEEKYFKVIKAVGDSKHDKTRIVEKLLSELEDKTLILVQSTLIKTILIKIFKKKEINVDEKTIVKGKIFKFLSEKTKYKKVCVMTHNEFKFSEEVFDNIIFIDPDLRSIRKLEIIQNRAELLKLKEEESIKNIYLIIYKDSLEEQKYLNEIRNEKNCFLHLIDEHSRLPLSNRDNKIYLDNDDEENKNKEYVVLIDFREMRSKLPIFIHRAENGVSISSLETGDYILGKNTCVERKAIPDLISSLNTGRLYTQAQMMTYKFSKCYLLIEFNRRPCLSDYFEYTERFNLMTKLVLFMLNFPGIRIIWSHTHILTVKVFRCLQKREEPPDKIAEAVDPILLELVLNIPGIDCFNYKRVMNSFKNIHEISQTKLEILNPIVGKEKATMIYSFFNKRL